MAFPCLAQKAIIMQARIFIWKTCCGLPRLLEGMATVRKTEDGLQSPFLGDTTHHLGVKAAAHFAMTLHRGEVSFFVTIEHGLQGTKGRGDGGPPLIIPLEILHSSGSDGCSLALKQSQDANQETVSGSISTSNCQPNKIADFPCTTI